MKSRIQLWGNSLALRIPKTFAREVGLAKNSEVELAIVDGELRIVPVKEQEFSLESLVAEITPENCHGEAFGDEPVGNEVW